MTMWSMVNGIWIHIEGLPAVLRCQTSTLARGLPEVGWKREGWRTYLFDFRYSDFDLFNALSEA